MSIEEDLEYGFTRFSSKKLPQLIQFETGTSCNVVPNCFMCPHSEMGRSGSAKWSTLVEIIEEIVPHAKTCNPFLMQEPLLEPRLINILNDIKYGSPNVKINLYTNMAAMTEELAADILETKAVHNISISFYGPTEEVYNKWQPGLDWETTKANIRRFIRMRDATGRRTPRVDMHMLCVKELMYWWPEFYAEWRPIADQIVVVPFDTFHGNVPDIGFHEFFETFLKGPSQDSGSLIRYTDDPAERAPCQRLWSTFTTLFNGDVVPCCIDFKGEMPMGNVREENAKIIWHNDKYNDLRRLHIERRFDEIPMCRDCNVWQYISSEEWQARWIK